METSKKERTANPGPPVEVVSILLVDDDLRNLDVLDSILSSADQRLVRAQTPEEALLALVNGEFACIILDIQMPTMNGVELARLIKTRKRSQHIPIIFLTAYFLEEKDILQGYGVGAVDYLTKPLNSAILKSKVGVFVNLFRTTHALAKVNTSLELEVFQRQKAEEALRQANIQLETHVQNRTADLVRVNNELREGREHYQQLVRSLPAAVYTTDAAGRVTLYNEAAVELWGREPNFGQDFWCGSYKIFNPDGTDLPPDQCPMARTLKEGRAVRGEEIIVERPDGTRRHVLPYPDPLLDISGKVIGAVNMLLDITERKQDEQKLKRANDELLAASRAKDDFLATLSHELRTPLNPILLVASDAVQNPEISPEVRADFEMIRKNVELEARLIDDLLDLTFITRGKVTLDKHPVDVHAVLQEAIAIVGDEIRQKQIELVLKLGAGQYTVFADAVRLQQIFWNLLRNAAKFTPEKGRVTVETGTSADNSRVMVKITDTGIGLNAGEISRIFNTFSQGDHAKKGGHRFGGLGLGLAISQKLVEFHNGKIEAQSEGRDRGSIFTVEFPLASGASDSSPVSTVELPHNTRPKNSIRILLVEDHAPTRAALAHLLARRAYEVIVAATIAEARSLASTQSFNLLISDIGLPDGNGYELMAELKNGSSLRGIALTGYGMEQDLARSRQAGFIAHLTKPVRIQSLEAALHMALESME